MIRVPAGSYLHGLPKEKTFVQVESFLIQTTVVTQSMWIHEFGGVSTDKQTFLPALATWDEVNQYLKLVRDRTSKDYRLATEVEWEAACRGKGDSYFSFGGDEALLGKYAWYKNNTPKEWAVSAIAEQDLNILLTKDLSFYGDSSLPYAFIRHIKADETNKDRSKWLKESVHIQFSGNPQLSTDLMELGFSRSLALELMISRSLAFDSAQYEWHQVSKTQVAQPVARKLPNSLGLYDMEGNCYEWVEEKLIKGGDIDSHPRQCRTHYSKEGGDGKFAFRLVL